MRVLISDFIYGALDKISAGDEVKTKFYKSPEIKPPRRNDSIKNKSNQGDYMKTYMDEYRKEKGDPQKVPESIKTLNKKNKQKIKEKFGLK